MHIRNLIHKGCFYLALFLALGLWLLSMQPAAAQGGVIYVDADATGNATGISWTDAYTNVQDALDYTNAHGGTDYEIWVAEGVYYPDEGAGHTADSESESFTLSYNNVKLYGGFDPQSDADVWSERDWESYLTVLSGDLQQDDTTDAHGVITTTTYISGTNVYHVLYLDGATHEPITETTVIDGFTITAGQADGSSYPHYRGGGVYCDGYGSGHECSPTLTNVVFSGNYANGAGGGMYDNAETGTSSPILTNVTFSGNRADYGGGIYNDGRTGTSSPALTNVIFSGNRADYGGGMYNRGQYAGGISSPALTNVLFSGNQADGGGGGMYNSGFDNGDSSPVLTNVTFGSNQAGGEGGGMYNNGDGGINSPALTNVILWGNTVGISGKQLYNSYATVILSYTLTQSGTNDIVNVNGSTITYGLGILTADPQFVAPITATAAPTTTGNYRLQISSPAIDAGDNAAIATSAITDLDGNPRIIGGVVDMGAYEAQPALALRKIATPTMDVAYHGVVTYTIILSNTGAGSDTNALFTDTLTTLPVAFAGWIVSPTNTSLTNGEIAWSGTVTAGEVLTWTWTVTHTGDYAETVTNTAEFSGTTQTGQEQAGFNVEPNYAPVLGVIGDRSVDELAELAFTATATDANVNDTLTFTLDAGSVGNITAGGDYTWTPTETDGPGIYTATVRVSDGVLEATETISITVNEANVAPVLNVIGDRTVDEMTSLTFTATATDSDLPAQVLTYTLDAGAPAGASIAPATGVFTWTPTEMQGPGIYSLTIRVSDGDLSDTITMTITVAEVNRPLTLWPIRDRTVDALTPFHFTARVTDPDWPLNPLTYTLDAGSVGNIGMRTGSFNWTPGAAPETYTATVRVSDGEFEDAASFTLTVNADTPGIGHWVLVANASDGPAGDPPPFSVSNFRLVDTADNAVYGPFLDGQLGSVGGARLDVVVTPDGQTALISNFGDRAIFLVNIANPIQPSLIASVTLPLFAEDIDISADGRYALVTDGNFSSLVASIDIPSATLVYTADLGYRDAQAVEVAPDGTVIVADYWGGVIHTLLLGETGEVITAGNTYTYTYPGYAITDTAGLPWPVNLGLSPDGQTLIVCDAYTSTVGVYQLVAPGVLTFTGVVTGLHGAFPEHENFSPGVQSVAFNPAGDKAYAVINRMVDISGTNSGDRLGILNITGPGQVSLAAGGVATVPHYTSGQLFGVDVVAVAGNQVYVSNPDPYDAADPTSGETSLAVVSLTDYSVTTTMVFTDGVSIPTGVAALPLRLDLHQAVSDSEPVPGQLVTYTLTLVSAGPQISGITLRDVLPPEVDFVGPITLSPPGAGMVSSAPPELVTNLVISAYQQVTVTFPVRVSAVRPGTIVTNAVQAESPKLNTAARAERTFTVAPHLALHKAVSDLTPNPHQVITYTLTLTNTGVADDPAVVLTDTLPQAIFNTWVTQPSGATAVDNEITWTGVLSSSTVLTFTFSVTQTGSYNQVVTNTAEIRGMGQTVTATTMYTVASNVAPVLALDDQSVDELVTLVFTATASDANGYPPLVYTLDAGSVGNITPGGVFTWTPSEADGPGVYTATIRVSDGLLSDTETISITVADVNSAPILAATGARTVNELTSLTFTTVATDTDIPTQTLTFVLNAGSVGSITAGGVFTWTPTEADGPGVYTATIRVSDGLLSDTETISITVDEVNTAPVLAPLDDHTVMLGATVHFTATATDADVPANPLTFTLDAGVPPGANLDPTTGAFTWTPANVGSTPVIVRVSDGELDDAAVFTVTVTPQPVYTLRIAVAGDGQGTVTPSVGVHEYVSGTTVIVTATAQLGSAFAGWSGAVTGLANPAQVTMDTDKVITATFALSSTENTAPTISAIDDQTTAIGVPIGPLPFTIDDAETDPAALMLTADSSDPTLVPTTNIVFSGSGADRAVTVTPADGLFGAATLTITVSDGELTASERFVLTVTPYQIYLPLVSHE